MPQLIHGHDVMQMMIDSSKPFTREGLRDAMVARWGDDAQYHTCSVSGMSADGLIEFLAARGKFLDVEGGFVTDPSRICNH